MTPGGSPWADPATPTEQGPPYVGPPATGPPPAPAYGFSPYGPPAYPQPYGQPPYGAGYPAPSGYPPSVGHPPVGYPAPYGYPAPWVPGPPPGPRRPGQVIGSAVLAFVQAAFVVVASLYVWFAVSLIGLAAGQVPTSSGSETARALAAEGNVLTVVGLVSAVLLIVAGVAGLTRRSTAAWWLLVVGHAAQVLLAAYWWIRLYTVLGDVPGTLPEGAFASWALIFAVAPVVALGLILLNPGRGWFDGTPRG